MESRLGDIELNLRLNSDGRVEDKDYKKCIYAMTRMSEQEPHVLEETSIQWDHCCRNDIPIHETGIIRLMIIMMKTYSSGFRAFRADDDLE